MEPSPGCGEGFVRRESELGDHADFWEATMNDKKRVGEHADKKQRELTNDISAGGKKAEAVPTNRGEDADAHEDATREKPVR
jgi:hypothetical protein